MGGKRFDPDKPVTPYLVNLKREIEERKRAAHSRRIIRAIADEICEHVLSGCRRVREIMERLDDFSAPKVITYLDKLAREGKIKVVKMKGKGGHTIVQAYPPENKTRTAS